jgi:hypothetical protein
MDACWVGYGDASEQQSNKRECTTFTAGRRAGLKEALKIVEHFKHHTDALYPVGCRQVRQAIRKAMKPARVK